MASSTLPGFLDPVSGFSLDMSAMPLDDTLLATLTEVDANGVSRIAKAHTGMLDIENGKIKNPDEGREVTHFSDRKTYTDSDICAQVQAFALEVKNGKYGEVDAVIINGIGGSALGPQLLQFALNGPYWNELPKKARQGFPKIYFLDNTDAAGVTDVLRVVNLKKVLTVTVSKSGKTQETINNREALEQAFKAAGASFAARAVAVTMEGSKLDGYAKRNAWLNVFPMAASIGGRTSETNIVGHVPAALTGIDFPAFVNGAKVMDEVTRNPDLGSNPAYQLAAAWYVAGKGKGDRNMVIVPYADRLVLMGKYLQQLVMESLGKELDLDGKVVHQGLTVYGNKGGTDAHAYIQQLNDGRNDFFATFIEVLEDSSNIEVEKDVTIGDYLHAFKQGLIKALKGKNRPVIDIVLQRLDAPALGMLIALYERAVAYYAELINVNAFHQPGVQAYKHASEDVNKLHARLVDWLNGLASAWSGSALIAATAIGAMEEVPEIDGLLAKFAANCRKFSDRTVSRKFVDGSWLYTVA